MGTIAGIAAYIALCAGVLTLFSFADKGASLQGKARARALLDFGWKDTVTRWPSVFVEMFDSIFGKRHFTWKCFGRSCVASLAALFLCSLVFAWVQPTNALSVYDDLWGDRIYFFNIVVSISLLPDYVSLLETRWVLKLMSRYERRSEGVGIALLVDAVLTFTVFAVAVSLAETVVHYYQVVTSGVMHK